jgi:hypothetical protein
LADNVIQQRGDSLHCEFYFGAVVPGSRVACQTAQEFGPSHNYCQLIVNPVKDFFLQHGRYLVGNAENRLPDNIVYPRKGILTRSTYLFRKPNKRPAKPSFAGNTSAVFYVGQRDHTLRNPAPDFHCTKKAGAGVV